MATNNLPVSSIAVKDYPQPNGQEFLNLDVEFKNWFTILSGPNGTGKSTILKKIKEANSDKTFLYNPKRNSERKAVQQVYEQIEREGRRKSTLISNKLSKGFDDNTFEPYSSFSEIVASDFVERWKTFGKTMNASEIIEQLKKEYGKLVGQIFPTYQLVDWNFEQGAPYFRVKKFRKYIFETQALSTGEQEILSLVFNIHFFQDSYGVLLIDEPEIHLNWALEDRLFKFLKDFANKKGKQIIVTTHSRVIFDDKLKDNCLFLFFDNNRKITISRDIPEEARREISGDIVKFVVSKANTKTIFVEDKFHKLVVEKLAVLLSSDKDFNIQIMSGKNAIKALFAGISQRPVRGIFKNAYYLIDGDGKSDPHTADNRYIHLTKYSLESYFLNFKNISAITSKDINEVKSVVCSALNDERKKQAVTGKIYLRGVIQPAMLRQVDFDFSDSSSILPRVIRKLRYKEDKFISDYLVHLNNRTRLKTFFDKKLINFFS